ncbi:hypothetical protein K432DRAFT_433754 [Lepidopterella palustris CBS 459.81]|uniref:PRISE-like Rossmann-fold domain-containing protein n=1 Tax=Lepidopterella palustris CBS 459.81 TaxID=1314670 RepID=A0A8E2EDV2_9PEZI|nr:hypothetical protein K432DRAFT_433754 [Lepidopterella palustris CBS 459.81]
MSTQTVFSKGTFHGLPSFPDHDGKKYSVIVTGANGITGAHIIRTLSESPSRWETIYGLSRKSPETTVSPNVKSLAIDFLKSPEEIAEKLKTNAIKADYVFFASYVQPPPKAGQGLWSDVEETERLNMLLLTNFLTALTLAAIIPNRVLLQTGAKHYGVHLGPTLTPMEESDPRFLAEPNFYFPQEDFLWKWCRENNTSWSVTRPGFIIGAVRHAAMNLSYGLGVYASVQKELGRPLEFPGDVEAWEAEKHLSAAKLIGYHADLFTYGKFWPVLAKWYGIEYGVPEVEEGKFQVLEMATRPPPRGFGQAGKVKLSWSFEAWAKRPEVLSAWKSIKDTFGLEELKDPFANVKDVFGLLDGEILGPWGRSISMNKSRKLGWHGFVDTDDGIFDAIQEMAAMKMLPPVEKQDNLAIKYCGY